ncbi:hypothetical protein LJK88_18735 [Paenibacillus sp. P26]|nr:hypothetical protein LJK88_18735 [Paenibacillus sp. P26]
MIYIQGKNEQGMVHAAAAYAKQKNRRQIFACTTSIGPGALNMVTAAATATVNRIPVLLLPGTTSPRASRTRYCSGWRYPAITRCRRTTRSRPSANIGTGSSGPSS